MAFVFAFILILFMLITNCGRREWEYEGHVLVCRKYGGDVMICKQVNFDGSEDFANAIGSSRRYLDTTEFTLIWCTSCLTFNDVWLMMIVITGFCLFVTFWFVFNNCSRRTVVSEELSEWPNIAHQLLHVPQATHFQELTTVDSDHETLYLHLPYVDYSGLHDEDISSLEELAKHRRKMRTIFMTLTLIGYSF